MTAKKRGQETAIVEGLPTVNENMTLSTRSHKRWGKKGRKTMKEKRLQQKWRRKFE